MLQNARILVVDDEERFRANLEKLLTRHGLEVLTASSGDVALEILSATRVDVVLLDLKMPGKSGVDVLQAMRDRKDDTAVIILTGHASLDAALDIMQFGPADYLLKPCPTDEIVAKIETTLERSKALRRPQA